MTDGRWIEVGDRVLVRRYEELDLSLGLVVGEEGCLVIDTGGDQTQGAEWAALVREVTPLPRQVLLTHSHFDHSFGTRPFLPCPVWAHRRCRADLAATGVEQRDKWARHYRESGQTDIGDRIAEVELVLPDRLVDDTADLDLGGRVVTLHHFGPAHSDHDLVALVRDADLVFAGDLVEQGAPPSFGGAWPARWPSVLDGILGLGTTTVLPGHGEPVDRDFVLAQRNELAVVAELCRAVAAGELAEDEAVRRSPYPAEFTRSALSRPAGIDAVG
ncbi:MBL fold metallo-hydrolase [Solihabitans fulvus]|uniref:MBL fold metallo-hydrolase n=1 Tax=Solihabitans fulvus TaxID=1892852 RepID=A0A5B2XQA5_9PSEU|nr:MBL fold metallo-hydrolase [Solihabitans fulvus]KAA2265255.1 MBL fold metallo-hydrolase [Solihabitans fulvus]